MTTNTLRVLLVDNDPRASDRFSDRLERASHIVLPINALEDAVQALEVQRFDAVLMTSRLLNDDVLNFRALLEKFSTAGRTAQRIPLVCYTPTNASEPSAEELRRYGMDGHLNEDFDETALLVIMANSVGGLSESAAGPPNRVDSTLPVLDADEFRDQVGNDAELIVEIVDLFLSDLDEQLVKMQDALRANDLLTLSRTAHCLKGSLGSLFARRAAASAQTLESAAKVASVAQAEGALEQLQVAITELLPALGRLRDTA